jgi:hypothetical protein
MNEAHCKEIGVIAGRGIYPHELVQCARRQGVEHISAVAFKGETRRDIAAEVDEITWLNVGQFDTFLKTVAGMRPNHFVMVGQIAPKNLFRTRPDKRMFELLKSLPSLNAHTLFGAVCSELEKQGVTLLPAHLFMESAMPAAGALTQRLPDEREQRDIELGLQVAKVTSGIDIGQTVVIKEGMIVAVEAFEGTDQTIRRAGKLAGRGTVVVKVAKRGHDMRFDIPVMGMRTLKTLRKAGVSAMAVEAGRTILLERERVCREADRLGMALMAVEMQHNRTENT